jgi:hypothetical protein
MYDVNPGFPKPPPRAKFSYASGVLTPPIWFQKLFLSFFLCISVTFVHCYIDSNVHGEKRTGIG